MTGSPASAGCAFTSYDASFAAVTGTGPRLVRVAAVSAHEGPVYAADEDALYFTTPPAGGAGTPGRGLVWRMGLDGLRFPVEPDRVTIVPSQAVRPNGMAMGRDGALVVCEQGDRTRPAQLSRIDRHSGRHLGDHRSVARPEPQLAQ
jgi:hypothetical protein